MIYPRFIHPMQPLNNYPGYSERAYGMIVFNGLLFVLTTFSLYLLVICCCGAASQYPAEYNRGTAEKKMVNEIESDNENIEGEKTTMNESDGISVIVNDNTFRV